MKIYRQHAVLKVLGITVSAIAGVVAVGLFSGKMSIAVTRGGDLLAAWIFAFLAFAWPAVFDLVIVTEDELVWQVYGLKTCLKWSEIESMSWQMVFPGLGYYYVRSNRKMPFRGKTIGIFSLMPNVGELKQTIVMRADLTRVSESGSGLVEIYERLTESERLAHVEKQKTKARPQSIIDKIAR